MRKNFLPTAVLLLLSLIFACSTKDHTPPSTVQSSTPSTALHDYLHNGDTTYHWKVKDSFTISGVKGYNLLLVSQKWHQYTWSHQLTILSPEESQYNSALLLISGGSNDKEGQPEWSGMSENVLLLPIAAFVKQKKATVAFLGQVPNQPLFNGLSEDALISYTLHQFIGNEDYSWPLLFPMVKSAVRAMDAVQEFANKKFHHSIDSFTVAGASKRGWTTWLTGAADPRVEAIAPMVIDILNMPVSLAYQIEAYGTYSQQIQDYVDLGIVQDMESPSGTALATMIDPYSYRAKLTMPKMLIMGTNDPYWVIDNVKNYLPEIPGNNMLHYIPNVGHSLGDGRSALEALSAFFSITIDHGSFPLCTWDANEKKKELRLEITSSEDILVGVNLWYANSEDRDFRDEKWIKEPFSISHSSQFEITVGFPDTGYKAFYVDLTYMTPDRNGTYTISTRAFMADSTHVL